MSWLIAGGLFYAGSAIAAAVAAKLHGEKKYQDGIRHERTMARAARLAEPDPYPPDRRDR